MSSVKFLERLLAGINFEWRGLAQLVEFKRGEQLRPIDLIPGPYPVVTASKTETGFHSEWNFGPASVTVTSHGAYAGHLNYWSTPIWLANNVFLLLPRSNLIPKFLFYYLKSNETKIQSLAKGGGVPYFNTQDIAPILIPIPCPENPTKSLEIQAEIVRILDNFVELTAELTAELAARKKQYNYYRDQLLSFEEEEIEWTPLGMITEINTGQKPIEIFDQPTGFDYINAGTSRSGYSAGSNCEGDTVTTPSRGQGGIGFVGYQRKAFWLGPLCYKIQSIDKNILVNKYLYYFLQSKSELLLGLKKEGGVPAVNKSDLAQLKIPLPSLNQQQRIVAILDKFDALTNSLIEGLPREISLRQQQYEYYRDLLLNFPRAEVGA